jgi:hypothetical protein
MHHDHSHGHTHQHDNDHHHDDDGHGGPGHNHAHRPRHAAQWQAPHLGAPTARPETRGEADLDKVEAAFIEGFLAASDPTSFLRLAGVPFKATAMDGAALSLLRVETEVVADIGSVTPHLGGGSFRYDPLPASLVARRRRLRFVYFDGAAMRALGFAAVRRELARSADPAEGTTAAGI